MSLWIQPTHSHPHIIQIQPGDKLMENPLLLLSIWIEIIHLFPCIVWLHLSSLCDALNGRALFQDDFAPIHRAVRLTEFIRLTLITSQLYIALLGNTLESERQLKENPFGKMVSSCNAVLQIVHLFADKTLIYRVQLGMSFCQVCFVCEPEGSFHTSS